MQIWKKMKTEYNLWAKLFVSSFLVFAEILQKLVDSAFRGGGL